MSLSPPLSWLPSAPDWRERFKAWRAAPSWDGAVALAQARLDALQTQALDAALARAFPEGPPQGTASQPLRLAVLGTSTVTHLLPAVRVAGLRRGLAIRTFEPDYGQMRQALSDRGSALHAFAPDAVLLAPDAHHVTAGLAAGATPAEAEAALGQALGEAESLWALAREAFRAPVLHQVPLPVFPALMGQNEHRLPGSRAGLLRRYATALRAASDRAGTHLLSLDEEAARHGLPAWHDPALWHRAKQEVAPGAAPLYGDLVARLLGTLRGRAAKCLVLDLDNTIWGGVVGDDGVDRLVLGQGSALGEGFAAVQRAAKDLAARGVILAVVSKNDEANALEAFARHPEMVLRRDDIACFLANWNDKATNLRAVARALNIGLDALVFVDDNPFERNLVRAELPAVMVPEVPEDPALVPQCLADAGYFESLGVTADDRARTAQYKANEARAAAAADITDMPAYLRSLAMRLSWRPFDPAGLVRITQLVNKTNQFNLTTRRMAEEEVRAAMDDPATIALQLRLTDRFGDNGTIAIVIGRLAGEVCEIDTWLMSCRVLGRGVEAATLAVLAGAAGARGVRVLRGTFRPTAKNAMVAQHYEGLGFTVMSRAPDGGHTAELALDDLVAAAGPITIVEG